MKHAFVDVNGVSTKIITWGFSVEETPKECAVKNLILCIPGNPGLTGFYIKFCTTIYEQTGQPVCIVSHAGHDDPQNGPNRNIPNLEGNDHLYTTEGQLEHKVAFIKKYIHPDTKLQIVAHSIGSYITKKMLKDESINKQIDYVYLLFPTIEYMVETPNGQFLYNIVRHVSFLVIYFSWFFVYMPQQIQLFLVRAWFVLRGWPQSEVSNAQALIYPFALEKIFFMGYDEMRIVREPDLDVLKDNKHKIKMYYGATDNWAPTSYCDKLKEKVPGLNAEICQRDFTHAFMLRDDVNVGKMVAGWIQERLQKV